MDVKTEREYFIAEQTWGNKILKERYNTYGQEFDTGQRQQ